MNGLRTVLAFDYCVQFLAHLYEDVDFAAVSSHLSAEEVQDMCVGFDCGGDCVLLLEVLFGCFYVLAG